eukprot:m.145190 g.145190  ORF g.145190 m.145190 type:complete len:1150 (-) comp14942_c0_seq1:1738-5187(-)
MKINEKELAHIATAPGPIDKQGYLEKRGQGIKDFKKRWFILKGNILFYFRSYPAQEPVGCIVLERIREIIGGETVPGPGGTLRHCFKIVFECPNQRVYQFAANSAPARESWIKAIEGNSYERLTQLCDHLRSMITELEARLPRQPTDESKKRNSVSLTPVATPTSPLSPKLKSSGPSAASLTYYSAGDGEIFDGDNSSDREDERELGSLCINIVRFPTQEELEVLDPDDPKSALDISFSARSLKENVGRVQITILKQHRDGLWVEHMRGKVMEHTQEPIFGNTSFMEREQRLRDLNLRFLIKCDYTDIETEEEKQATLCHDNMTREDAEEKLRKEKQCPGNYLVFKCDEQNTSFGYSVIEADGRCKHFSIQLTSEGASINEMPERGLGPHPTLSDVIGFLSEARTKQQLPVGELIKCSTKKTGPSTVYGWAECQMEDLLDENDLVIEVSDPETISIQEPRRQTLHYSRDLVNARAGIHSEPLPALKLGPKITFKFGRLETEVKSSSALSAFEHLGESLFFLSIPYQLLRIFVSEDKMLVQELEKIEDLSRRITVSRGTLQSRLLMRVNRYLEHVAFIDRMSDVSFKKSVDKKVKELEMFALNLHVHRLEVQEVEKSNQMRTSRYDIITHGAFTAHALGFKNGGLARTMFLNQEGRATYDALQSVWDSRQRIVSLQDSVLELREILGQQFVQNKEFSKADLDELLKNVNVYASQCLSLESCCMSGAIPEARLVAKRTRAIRPGRTISRDRSKAGATISQPDTLDQRLKGLRNAVQRKRDCVETLQAQVRTEFSLPVVKPLVEDLHKALDDIHQFFEMGVEEAKECLLIYELGREDPDDRDKEDIVYRRDVCFSQACTALVTAFTSFIALHQDQPIVLEQMMDIGFLVHFESLLSTQGNEMGMIEDMWQTLKDLANVTLRPVEQQDGKEIMSVSVLGRRNAFCLEVTVTKQVLDNFPREKKDIKVFPVFFSQGVNEMQLIARNIGGTELQELICEEGLLYLKHYVRMFKNFYGDPNRENPSRSTYVMLDQKMALLDKAVRSKSARASLDILRLSEQVCRLVHGSRLTCCKSGKDRTGMSATLEECEILIDRHGMKRADFQKTLDAARSYGVRMKCVEKNIGERRYAFNKLQVMALPKLLRPPPLAIGSSVT